jgi:hypothetical protein
MGPTESPNTVAFLEEFWRMLLEVVVNWWPLSVCFIVNQQAFHPGLLHCLCVNWKLYMYLLYKLYKYVTLCCVIYQYQYEWGGVGIQGNAPLPFFWSILHPLLLYFDNSPVLLTKYTILHNKIIVACFHKNVYLSDKIWILLKPLPFFPIHLFWFI